MCELTDEAHRIYEEKYADPSDTRETHLRRREAFTSGWLAGRVRQLVKEKQQLEERMKEMECNSTT